MARKESKMASALLLTPLLQLLMKGALLAILGQSSGIRGSDDTVLKFSETHQMTTSLLHDGLDLLDDSWERHHCNSRLVEEARRVMRSSFSSEAVEKMKYDNSTCELEELHASAQLNPVESKRNVTAFVFAGRRQYMAILVRYLSTLLDLGLITDVHMWDMTQNKKDAQWLQDLSAADSRYEIKMDCHPSSSDVSMSNKRKKRDDMHWACAYQHYVRFTRHAHQSNNILLKLDDDIVFVDVPRFESYISAITENGHLYFPNIINNDVCAHIQSRMKVHDALRKVDLSKAKAGATKPLTEWYKDTDAALKVHSMFHSCPTRFQLEPSKSEPIDWNSRISINWFGMTYETAHEAFKGLVKNFQSKRGKTDEAWLTGRYPVLHKSSEGSHAHKIMPGFTVAHFGFSLQRENDNFNQLPEQLAKYGALSIALTCTTS